MSQNFTWPATLTSPPVGGATAANQVLEIAELTAINTNTSGLLTDAELRAAPVPVSATSLPLPTGAATAANQTTANASLASIDGKLTSPLAVTGPLTDAQLRASAVPVSLAASPLPTGAATAANQTAVIGTDGVAGATTALVVAGQTAAGIVQILETNASGHLNIADGGGSITVDGPLTDAQLRATPVPVSGTVSTGGLTNTELRASAVPVSLTSTTITGSVAVTGPLTDTQLRATAVPISASALPLPTGAATQATLNTLTTKSASAFVTVAFDETIITYVGATDRINTITYRLAASTVATLTMSYDGSNRLTGVVRT